MADEQSPDRDIYIESNVNVGSAKDRTNVSGAKVSVGAAREVHIHGETTPPPSFRSVALVGVLAFLGAVFVNIATSQLPPGLQPYLWLSWPLALLVTAASIWIAYRQSLNTTSSVALGGSLEQRSRRAMLTKVRRIWIDGLLEQSLAKELRITLGLTEQPDSVHLPLNALVQELNYRPRSLPTGTPIIEVFEQMSGALLILGAPGAGKTTLLLELGRDLLARAEQDENQPIPVVFNLSSWGEKRRPLKDWLVEELNTKYDVPRKLAQAWIDADVILPLLDGLDEVAAEQRANCAGAINLYRQAHGLVPLTVCSRVKDYEALTTKLRLRGAIAVQPLTQQQIDAYIERAGEKLMGVQAALRDDIALREMVDTPLMLSMVTLAYAGKLMTEVSTVGTLEDRRRHLFDAYIAAMFQRRSKETRYTKQQTLRWLCWLAWGMTWQAQTEFLVERLQPEWLPTNRMRWEYILLDRCGSGLVYGLIYGSVSWLIFGPVYGLAYGLVAVPFGGQSSIETLQSRSTRKMIADALFGGLTGGLVGGLVGGLFSGPIGPSVGVIVGGLSGGLSGGLLGILTGKPSISARHVIVVERLRWTLNRAWRSATSGLAVGVAGGAVFGVIGGLSGGLTLGLVVALFGGLFGGLLGGLGGGPLTTAIQVNQGIRRSARSALVGGLFFGLVVGLFFELANAPYAGLTYGLVYGLVGGLASGLIGLLSFGGYASLSHLALRLTLSYNNLLPLRLVPFLDYCTERIFLRRVGGGYIFVHRLLMEHFASLYSETPTK